MKVEDVSRLFPGCRWEVRQTSSGTEVLLQDCPIDLKNLGPEHPRWKTYVNPDKEVLKCFVCHAPGQGMKISTLRRRLRRTQPSTNQAQNDMRWGVKELPPIPDGCYRVDEIDPVPDHQVHPMYLYLGVQRGFSYETILDADILWKPEGVPAWTKQEEGREFEVGTYPGIIIPIYTRGDLVGWQLSAVPRQDFIPKYVTAPGSRLAGCLYNFDNVAGRSRVAVVTEGVFDALRVPEIGVALLIDNINKRKRRLLSTGGFTEVVLCLDSDRDDRHINKQLSFLQGVAPVVRAVRLEEGDPGDYPTSKLMNKLFGDR